LGLETKELEDVGISNEVEWFDLGGVVIGEGEEFFLIL